MLMTDTDSLFINCETPDIYSDMKECQSMFDTSDYPKDHYLYSEVNKKTLGKMKDEANSVPISKFAGLRSKMYAFTLKNTESKRAKGISKITVQKDLQFETYEHALFNETQVHSTMTSIRSHLHRIYGERIIKAGLSCFDDKRYILENGIDSLAYGHYMIKNHVAQ